jgi:hypothetical protein
VLCRGLALCRRFALRRRFMLRCPMGLLKREAGGVSSFGVKSRESE